MKSKWNIYRLCTEPDQRRGLFGESEHSLELNFLSLETFPPTSSQALGVNQRHKGYDVRLVTNDNMMCTETTWQCAAINLGARHGPLFRGRSNTAQDKTYFCLHAMCCQFWPAVPWKRSFLNFMFYFRNNRRDNFSTKQQSVSFELCVKIVSV